MLRRASEVVLTIEMSSRSSGELVLCCWGIGCTLGGCSGLAVGVSGDWGGGEGFRKEAGRLGLGACQFGESERLGLLADGSLWGGRSLQSPKGLGLGSWDLQDVRLPSRSAGGMYRGGPLPFELVGARF